MIKSLVLAAGIAIVPAIAMAQNQGQPNGLPEAPSLRNEMGFRQHVLQQAPLPFVYERPVTVGTVLPPSGVVYYEVPAQYGAPGYRYTVVNDRTVLVDPQTRRIVQIIE